MVDINIGSHGFEFNLKLICTSKIEIEIAIANLFQIERENLMNEKNRINHDINMEKFAWRKCRKIFLEAIFSHARKLFSKFQHKMFVIILLDVIFLENFLLSFSQS